MYSLVQYGDRPKPLSRPGCWAYPDMLEVGNFEGQEPLRTDEEKTHFGLWCVASAPLVLTFDMSNIRIMDRVWPIITNLHALHVNQAWAGHPGTLVKSYRASGLPLLHVGRGNCGTHQSKGWYLSNGQLHSPIHDFCLSSDLGPQSNQFCPPPTTQGHHTGLHVTSCGNLITSCSEAVGYWNHTEQKLLRWRENQQASWQCLWSSPPSGVDGFFGGPKGANTLLDVCPYEREWVQHQERAQFFFTSDGELKLSDGHCLIAEELYGVQLWSKPLPGDRVAALVLNLVDVHQRMKLPLDDIPGLTCKHRCAVRDIWAKTDTLLMQAHLEISLRAHESVFYIISNLGSQDMYKALVPAPLQENPIWSNTFG